MSGRKDEADGGWLFGGVRWRFAVMVVAIQHKWITIMHMALVLANGQQGEVVGVGGGCRNHSRVEAKDAAEGGPL